MITQAKLDALRTRIIGSFMKGTEAPTEFEGLFARYQAQNRKETFAWLADIFPAFRRWVGPRHFHKLTERTFEITTEKWESSVTVNREDVEDNNLVSQAAIAEGVGRMARQLDDDMIVELLQNGTTRLAYDGQYFFDADHPTDMDTVTGSQQNLWASGMPLTEANLITVVTSMSLLKGENGRILGINPDTLYVPPQLTFTAKKIVDAPLLASGATNVVAGMLRVVTLKKLGTEPDAWYVGATGQGFKPFIILDRTPVEMVAKFSMNDDNVFYRDTYDFGARVRRGAGYGLWQTLARAKA